AVHSRRRRIALVAGIVACLPATISYAYAMSQPSNSALGIRSVEWLRDHGAAGLVAKVESIYYSLTAPSKGGPTLKTLPSVGYGTAGTAPSGPPDARPEPLTPFISPALPGEGVWRPTRRDIEGGAP